MDQVYPGVEVERHNTYVQYGMPTIGDNRPWSLYCAEPYPDANLQRHNPLGAGAVASMQASAASAFFNQISSCLHYFSL